MTPKATIALVTAIAAIAAGVGCKRAEKRVLRTEPWPAPAVASSSPLARATVAYHVERGAVRVDLSTRKAKPLVTLERIEGRVDVDYSELVRTRGNIRVDLLSLSASGGEGGQVDPSLTRRAFDWLELGSLVPQADRDQNRWAELRLTALAVEEEGHATPSRKGARRGHAVGYAELTLHRFRVPVTVDLEVELDGAEGIPESLRIRTRRPLTVPLAAHDILPRASDGTLATESLGALGTQVAREGRVTVDMSLRRTVDDAPRNP